MHATRLWLVFAVVSFAGFQKENTAWGGEGTIAGQDSPLDYGAFHDCLAGPAAAIPANCASSNFHADTHIDLIDFAVLQRSYLTLAPSPVQLGVETAGELAPADNVDEFSFFAEFGTTVTVDLVTPLVNSRPDIVARVDLVRPNGTSATSAPSCGTTLRIDNAVIDVTGQWKVRVSVYESWASCGFGADEALRTGIYTLTVCLSNVPPVPIAYGQTRRGSFAADCQIVNYLFDGAEGDIVTALYFGPAFARWLRLYAPNGALLTNSGGGAGTGLFDVNLPTTGTYRLAVEAQDGQTNTGGFSVGLTELHQAIPLTSNVAHDDTLSKPAEAHLYSFEGTAGSKVTVDFATTLVGPRSDLFPRMDLIRPDGSSASSNVACGINLRLDSIPINMDGTWTVRLRPYESWIGCGQGSGSELLVGDYTVTVCTSDSPPTPIAYGQSAGGTISADCQVVNYEFQGSAGDSVTVLYFGGPSIRHVQLFAPNGALLTTTGGGAGTGFLDLILPADGAYRLAVEAADNQAGGNFTIGLSELGNCAPIGPGTPTNQSLAGIGEADPFCFEGQQGTLATIDFSTTMVENRPDIVSRVDLVRPNGTFFTSTVTCGTNARIDLAALDMSGTWTARVRAYESWFNCGHGSNTQLITGNYTLTVCTSDTPAIPIAYEQSTQGAFLTDCDIVNYEFDGGLGDVVTILYIGPTITRGMRLYDPNGALLTSSGFGTASGMNDVHLPLTGTYRLAVEAADSQSLGAFTLSLSELSNSVPIGFNTPTAGTISPVGEMDNFAFDAPFGSIATVEFETPLVANRPDVIARFDLIRPDGVLQATNATCGAAMRFDSVALNRDGNWTVRVRSYESWFNCGQGADPIVAQGNYTLTVCPSTGIPTDIAYGQTRAGNFAVDCQMDNYEFDGTLGDSVTAMFLGPATARRLLLYAPNGTLLFQSSSGTCPVIFDFALPATGSYRLLSEAADGQPIGAYSIALNEAAAPVAVTINVTRAGSLSQIAEVDNYSFAGTSGSAITVDFTTPSVLNRPDVLSRVDLVRPNGTTFTGTASCGNTARINNATLDATGTWTVRVRAYENWCGCGFGTDTNLLTGNYNVTVCNSVNCP